MRIQSPPTGRAVLCYPCVVLAFAIVCTGFLGGEHSHAADKGPNIVLILVDDLGRLDMSFEGSTFHETPNIDRLASRAMRFSNGFAACQVCSPSRAAIQTGKYPPRLQITDYIGAPQPAAWKRNTKLLPAPYQTQLALEETTLAEGLKSVGYQTFFAGKWHLGGQGHLPTDQGYDINRGGHAAGSPPGGFFSPYKNPQLENGPPGELLPLRLGRETADFIKQSQSQPDKPFFAMLSFYSVHAPIQTTKELWQKYRDKAAKLGLDKPELAVQLGVRKSSNRFLFDRTQEVRQIQDNPLYAGMMESMDAGVGLVLQALDDAKLADNTVVIFTSDNGGVSSGDGYATSSLPFRGGKGRQWEGGIREPFYIYWPGVTDANNTGTDNPTLASHIDFFPTLMNIAGAPQATYKDVDGISLVPLLRGESLPERNLFWHYPHYGNQGGEPSAIMRSGDWKLIHYFEDGHNELYNIGLDAGEQNDLAATEPNRVDSMLAELKRWQQSVGAIDPTPNPNFDAAKREKELKQQREVAMANREREHASYLLPDFVPRGGWWQENAMKSGGK